MFISSKSAKSWLPFDFIFAPAAEQVTILSDGLYGNAATTPSTHKFTVTDPFAEAVEHRALMSEIKFH